MMIEIERQLDTTNWLIKIRGYKLVLGDEQFHKCLDW